MMKALKYLTCVSAICAVLAACSSVSPSNRASLIEDRGGPGSGYQNGNAMSGEASIRYYDRLEPRSFDNAVALPQGSPRPVTAAPTWSKPMVRPDVQDPPLRRFAAMPRYMPPAPHVRQNEASCLESGIVKTTAFVRPRSSIGGGQCFIGQPYLMFAAANGGVRMEPAATLRCQMVPSVETWVAEVLRPAARNLLGSDVVQLRVAGSYGCRSRNHQSGARLSEHGRGNALDISKFHLADGRVITVVDGWHGAEGERRFLRYIHRGACEHFSTVLGPNADRYHRDHFHFDLARHGNKATYRVCK